VPLASRQCREAAPPVGDEGEKRKEKKRETDADLWASTWMGIWEFGQNGAEGINQNFYGIEGKSKNLVAYKKSI
jgi:hypothetical protein